MAMHDAIVIGGGPGGYVAAIRAAQAGLSAAVVEKESKLGGTCLRVGCIPSKALLESSHKYEEAGHDLAVHGVKVEGVALDLATMMARKDEVVASLAKGIEALLKKNKVARISGTGRLAGAGRVEVTAADGTVTTLESPRIILAVGSRPWVLPGIEVDGDRIGTSTEALAYPEVPEHLVVIGGGYIGLELGSVWRRLGSRVTVLEYADRILLGIDGDIAAEALTLFRKQGLDIRLGVKVTSAKAVGTGCLVEVEGGEPIQCDRVLAAIGRRPATDGIGLETVGLEPDPRGFIPVDGHFRTAAPGVWAIGDLVGGPWLAHKAMHEGVIVAEKIAGVKGVHPLNTANVAGCTYCWPQVASVGMTEDKAKGTGRKIKVGKFPFIGNGKAIALGEAEGMIKTVFDATTGELLGAHMIGAEVTELIQGYVIAKTGELTDAELSHTIFPHPTVSEMMHEAVLAADGAALHI